MPTIIPAIQSQISKLNAAISENFASSAETDTLDVYQLSLCTEQEFQNTLLALQIQPELKVLKFISSKTSALEWMSTERLLRLFQTINQLKNLETISMSRCGIYTWSATQLHMIRDHLGDHPSLQNIDLSWNHLNKLDKWQSIHLALLLLNLPQLTSVNLGWNNLASPPLEPLSYLSDLIKILPCLKKLNSLNMEGNHVNQLGNEAFQLLCDSIISNKTLTQLKMNHNDFEALQPTDPKFSFLVACFTRKRSPLEIFECGNPSVMTLFGNSKIAASRQVDGSAEELELASMMQQAQQCPPAYPDRSLLFSPGSSPRTTPTLQREMGISQFIPITNTAEENPGIAETGEYLTRSSLCSKN